MVFLLSDLEDVYYKLNYITEDRSVNVLTVSWILKHYS